MKRGRTLEELGRELERQRRARKDFVADTRKLTFQMKGTTPTLCIEQKDGLKPYPLNDLAQQQLASRLQIPFRYYQKMQNEYPALLETMSMGGFIAHRSGVSSACWTDMSGHSSRTATGGWIIWSSARPYCLSSGR